MTGSRENHLVELVDNNGRPLGQATVEEAHLPPGRLHRAFSVVLVDPDGRMLLQRRAATKTRFPMRWANACCGHPSPDDSVTGAANRRLREEIGLAPVALAEVGVYVYYAEDPATKRVEFEYDHVLLAEIEADEPLVANPDEVADVRWVDRVALAEEMRASSRSFAPWLAGVVTRLEEYEQAARLDATGADAAERSGGR
ncbi:MAG TPA: isopentenyl-diphosphate Delta-isomerase [Asanoa sp.]